MRETKITAYFSYLHNINNRYQLETNFGFGTGAINHDSHNYTDSSTNSRNEFFLGLKLHTPFMNKYGGTKFVAEYDGWGINFGALIPISYAWSLNLGITHFENLVISDVSVRI